MEDILIHLIHPTTLNCEWCRWWQRKTDLLKTTAPIAWRAGEREKEGVVSIIDDCLNSVSTLTLYLTFIWQTLLSKAPYRWGKATYKWGVFKWFTHMCVCVCVCVCVHIHVMCAWMKSVYVCVLKTMHFKIKRTQTHFMFCNFCVSLSTLWRLYEKRQNC